MNIKLKIVSSQVPKYGGDVVGVNMLDSEDGGFVLPFFMRRAIQ